MGVAKGCDRAQCFLRSIETSGCALQTILQGIQIMGRGILLWLLGVPLPIILLLAMCSHR
jgi:hypothetical protein